MKHMVRSALVIFLVMLAHIAFADAAYESYNVKYRDIARTVLRDTAGVLTINARWGWEPEYHVEDLQIAVYEKASDGFKTSKAISLLKETRWLTSYGYSGTGSFRFPLIEESGNYCQIVTDPQADRRIWINREELARNLENGVEIKLFDSLDNFVNVDLFFFTDSKKKKIYSEPVKDSSYKVVDEKTWPALSAAETRNGFVRLTITESNEDSDPEKPLERKTVGWARIRDNEGLLTVWLISACE